MPHIHVLYLCLLCMRFAFQVSGSLVPASEDLRVNAWVERQPKIPQTPPLLCSDASLCVRPHVCACVRERESARARERE